MPAPIPLQDVQRGLSALGVTPNDFDVIRKAPFPQAQILLQELKAKARRAYKRLALELHPDRTQGDEAKAALFVLVGRILEELEKATVQPPAPPPQVVFTVVTSSPWQQASPWTSTSSSTTTSTTYGPTQVIRIVRMRPK